LYCSQNIYRVIKTRRITWAGRVASMGEMRNTGKLLVGKTEGNQLLGRPRLDRIIYCSKRLQFCHEYSNASSFFFPDSVCKLCVRQRHLAQLALRKAQQHKNSASSWLCRSTVKGFGSQQWKRKSLKRRVTLLQQLLNSGFLTVMLQISGWQDTFCSATLHQAKLEPLNLAVVYNVHYCSCSNATLGGYNLKNAHFIDKTHLLSTNFMAPVTWNEGRQKRILDHVGVHRSIQTTQDKRRAEREELCDTCPDRDNTEGLRIKRNSIKIISHLSTVQIFCS